MYIKNRKFNLTVPLRYFSNRASCMGNSVSAHVITEGRTKYVVFEKSIAPKDVASKSKMVAKA